MSFTVEFIGPWVLLSAGALLLLGGLCGALIRKQPTPWPQLMLLLIFGLGSSGVGVHGLPFFEAYTPFVDAILAYARNPTQDGAEGLMDKLLSTDAPPEYHTLAADVLVSTPPPDMEELLTRAEDKAPGGARRVIVDDIRARYDTNVQSAATIARVAAAQPDAIAREDLTEESRDRLVRPLLRMSDDRLRELKLRRSDVERLRRRP